MFHCRAFRASLSRFACFTVALCVFHCRALRVSLSRFGALLDTNSAFTIYDNDS